jgi:Phosphoketolase
MEKSELPSQVAEAEQWRERWSEGYGVIQHKSVTIENIAALGERLGTHAPVGDGIPFYELLYAADRVASAAMWLVVHQTYARAVYLDGRPLEAEDFKKDPQGHTGGSLNMVPAYVGYLAANALAGRTRAWLMGQGHCVSAIDSVNLLCGNMSQAHAARYSISDDGLTRFVRDFYSYRVDEHGRPASPLGSHVNAHTAGGLLEGGYLGFAEVQYIHMPIPGETLVTFLSDGAFEEQRGADWAPRWWRAEDCGIALPIMIANGRRIDQRTTMSMEGGVAWFVQHLRLNAFDPIVFDGRDPAAFVWAIFEMEDRLRTQVEAIRTGKIRYPVRLPYGIAVAPKGAGFYNEGTNLAHNLPLMTNPRKDPEGARLFNEYARRLWVPADELLPCVGWFQQHQRSGRPREKDNPLVRRNVSLREFPEPRYKAAPDDRRALDRWTYASPMSAVDDLYVRTCQMNRHLRPRVGNPDEMKSNRMLRTLEVLKFRVTDPEQSVPEAVEGAVITALNEEAVAGAALANKAGINIIVTYEAFATKMYGAVRQEVTWEKQKADTGRPSRWLSIPLILTSHTWENGKNEYSHQDPTMAEAMLAETSEISRVLFAADYNSAAALMNGVYRTHGQIWTVVVPKSEMPDLLTGEEAGRLLQQGAVELEWAGYQREQAEILLTAMGSFQLVETVKAAFRLSEKGIPHRVIYMVEPARFRKPRSDREAEHMAPDTLRWNLYPPSIRRRLFVTHTRPEPIRGLLQPLVTGSATAVLGFLGNGGTLDANGMLFVNECTWAHCVAQSACLLDLPLNRLLTRRELEALEGSISPSGVIIPEPAQ